MKEQVFDSNGRPVILWKDKWNDKLGKYEKVPNYEEMYDLKPYLNNEKQLRLHLEKAIELKPKEHHFEEDISYTRMNEIGG